MATLGSTSTDAEVEAAYDDNASFEEDNSVAKARIFLTACRILIRRLLADTTRNANAIRFDRERIAQEIERAENFISRNPDPVTSPNTTYADLRRYDR